MTKPRQDQALFEWPEPVVIDVVCERYQDLDADARTTIARLQAAALRELVAGRLRQAAALRLELIAACAARGVAAERIGRADLAVLFELTQIATARYRNSPRLKAEACERLDAALTQLRPEPESLEQSRPERSRPRRAAAAGTRSAAAIG